MLHRHNQCETSQWWATPAGNQFMYVGESFNGGNTISQAVALSAGSNTLSFLQSDYKAGNGGQIYVDVLDTNSKSIFSGPKLFETSALSNWVHQSLTFDAATAGNYTLEFTSVIYHAGVIDDVKLNPVPEPSTMALGVAAVGLLVRRRRQARKV